MNVDILVKLSQPFCFSARFIYCSLEDASSLAKEAKEEAEAIPALVLARHNGNFAPLIAKSVCGAVSAPSRDNWHYR